jgi:hypothetical protein
MPTDRRTNNGLVALRRGQNAPARKKAGKEKTRTSEYKTQRRDYVIGQIVEKGKKMRFITLTYYINHRRRI